MSPAEEISKLKEDLACAINRINDLVQELGALDVGAHGDGSTDVFAHEKRGDEIVVDGLLGEGGRDAVGEDV